MERGGGRDAGSAAVVAVTFPRETAENWSQKCVVNKKIR